MKKRSQQVLNKSEAIIDSPFEMIGQQPEVQFELDTARSIKQGFRVLILGLGLCVVWATFAPLDEGVPTEGKVSNETNSKVVQHLSGGIVEKIHVKEGQFVKKGDILLTIDASTTKAKFEEIRQQYLGLRSYENRLISEKNGKQDIHFHADLTDASTEPDVLEKMNDQSRLLVAKSRLLTADLGQIEESMKAEQASIEAGLQMIANKKQELILLKQQTDQMKSAVDEGFIPKLQFNELLQRSEKLSGEIAQVNGDIAKSRRVISELNNKKTSRIQSEQKEINEELAKIRLEVDADAEKFKALKNDLERTVIKAPVDGQVIALQVQTLGAVIQPGQRLLHIAPKGERLLLDTKIPPHLIDRIAEGQPADVRFSSFAHSPQLLVEGKVISVSTDIMSDPSARVDGLRHYYLARVELTDAGNKTLGKRALKPGMPVQIVIKTGERSYLDYMLHPLTKKIAASLKEE